MARPSVMIDEVLEELRKAYLMGCTDEEASVAAGIARSTLSEYKRLNPEFSDKVDAWKLNPVFKARKTLYENLDKDRVAVWFLERKCRDEFSNRKGILNNFEPVQVKYILDGIESDYDDVAQKAKEELIWAEKQKVLESLIGMEIS